MTNSSVIEDQKFEIAAEIGMAIEKWSLCELMIPYIVSSASDNDKTPLVNGVRSFSELSHIECVLHTAINSIIGFDARMDMADNLIELSNVKKMNKLLWEKFSRRMRKKYKTRHKIAHFIFTEIEDKPLMITPFAASVFDDNEKRLCINDIKARKRDYHEIYDNLVWFRRDIEKEKGRLQVNLEPMPELIKRFVEEVSRPTPQA